MVIRRLQPCPHSKHVGMCRKGCPGSRYCFHGVQRHRCRHGCGGGSICKHGIFKHDCFHCADNKEKFCMCGKVLSYNRRTLSIKVCATCERYDKKMKRLEHIWLEKFIGWGYIPSFHDSVVRDKNCKVVNRRRSDYLFITELNFTAHLLVECDETSHGHIPIPCEMVRLQEIHDQIFSNTGSVKPLVIIRFNPNAKCIDDQLKTAIEEFFEGKCTLGDARGVNIHKLIGYSETRRKKYKDSELSKKLLI